MPIILLLVSLNFLPQCAKSRLCSDIEPTSHWSGTPFLFPEYSICKSTLHDIELQGTGLRFETEVDRITTLARSHSWRPVRETYLHNERRYVYVVDTGDNTLTFELVSLTRFRGEPLVLTIRRDTPAAQ